MTIDHGDGLRRLIYSYQLGLVLLALAKLAVVYRICRCQPATSIVHWLLPVGDNLEEAWH